MELRKEKFVIPAGNRPSDRLKGETGIMGHFKIRIQPASAFTQQSR